MSHLEESAKLAFRALQAAYEVILTIEPENDDESEKLVLLKYQMEEASSGLFLHLNGNVESNP